MSNAWPRSSSTAWRRPQAGVDFTTDVAVWYPLRVIMSILGVAPEDEALMLRLTQQVLTGQDPELGSASEAGAFVAAMELFQFFKPIIADRRANPRDDIASIIANAEIDGVLLAERDVFGYFLIIATAGHDTTSYSLAGGLLRSCKTPISSPACAQIPRFCFRR